MVVTLTDPSLKSKYVPNIFQWFPSDCQTTNQYRSKPTITSMNARKATVRFLPLLLLQSLKTPGWDVWETGSADESCWIGRGGLCGKTLGLHLSLLGGRCQCHLSEDEGWCKFGNNTVDASWSCIVRNVLYIIEYYRHVTCDMCSISGFFFAWFKLKIS